MNLKELQDSLVEHQKQRDELAETVTEIVNKMKSLQAEYQHLIQQGQLVEGGILLLDSLITQEKEKEDGIVEGVIVED